MIVRPRCRMAAGAFSKASACGRCIEREATPIRRIHVSDKGRFGFARIDAQPSKALNALGLRGHEPRHGCGAVATIAGIVRDSPRAGARRCVELEGTIGELSCEPLTATHAQRSRRGWSSLRTARDPIARETAGIGATTWDYEQTALVTNVFTQRFHDHVAYERFTPNGPDRAIADVRWTLRCDLDASSRRIASEVARCAMTQFLARLQEAFGFRLGRFTRVGARQLYPLVAHALR